MNKSFCSIITESAYFSNKEIGACYNSISITEKTARALCNLHPFIIVSGKGSLKFLKSIGIQMNIKYNIIKYKIYNIKYNIIILYNMITLVNQSR